MRDLTKICACTLFLYGERVILSIYGSNDVTDHTKLFVANKTLVHANFEMPVATHAYCFAKRYIVTSAPEKVPCAVPILHP